MLSKIAQTIGRVNQMAMAPFQAKLPLATVALLFVLALVLATQWRLIVDRIEEVE